MNDSFSLGARLRELRKERSLSQRELARRADVSANAISLIERDEISPSVATLQRLAGALQMKISYFFEYEEEEQNIIHVKADNSPSLVGSGVTISGVGRRLHGQEIEPFFVVLAPGAESGEQPVAHSGHELVCCLAGTVEYRIGQELYVLQEGDFLLFEAELPHHWRNPTPDMARLLLVLQTSDESIEPIRRHFSSHPSVTHLTS